MEDRLAAHSLKQAIYHIIAWFSSRHVRNVMEGCIGDPSRIDPIVLAASGRGLSE